MVYINAAKGYKPGGFDYRTDNPDFFRFDSETSWTYEAGTKTVWLDKKLSLDLAAFYTHVSDYQDIISYDPYTFSYRNVGSADIWGLESSVALRPVTGMELKANAGCLEAKYHDYIDPATGANYDGKNIVLTPQYTFGLAAQYRFDLGLYMRGELNGYGKVYLDQANTNQLAPYALANARIGYKIKLLDVYIYGKNLTNKEYYVMGVDKLGIIGEPRMVGIGVILSI
jgi:iron complex outermembrane receptor protein